MCFLVSLFPLLFIHVFSPFHVSLFLFFSLRVLFVLLRFLILSFFMLLYLFLPFSLIISPRFLLDLGTFLPPVVFYFDSVSIFLKKLWVFLASRFFVILEKKRDAQKTNKERNKKNDELGDAYQKKR